MPIRDNDPRPAYEQLADELRQAIAAGDYQPGDRLPSTRELSEQHGIAPMTVRNALRQLEDEHLVVARQGRGVFVQAPPPAEPAGPDRLAAARASLRKTIGLLEQLNQQLDRHDAQRPNADRGSQVEQGKDVGRATEPAALDPDDDLDQILEDLEAADAVLDEAAPGINYDFGPEPDRGPDLGL